MTGPFRGKILLCTIHPRNTKGHTMNQKELNEIRRRFRSWTGTAFPKFSAAMSAATRKSSPGWTPPWASCSREEQEMYLAPSEKGPLRRPGGKIWWTSCWTPARWRTATRAAFCKPSARRPAEGPLTPRETLCHTIIDALDMGETNYLILLAADTYDVPHKSRDDEFQADAGGHGVPLFRLRRLPGEGPHPGAAVRPRSEREFHPAPPATSPWRRSSASSTPPLRLNRAANLYNALVLHQEPGGAEPGGHRRPVPVEPHVRRGQKNVFDTALTESPGPGLQLRCGAVRPRADRAGIEDHKESHDLEPLN